jgi:hypothetical protein
MQGRPVLPWCFMSETSPDDIRLLDEYIDIIDAHGTASSEAEAFRSRFPQMAEAFARLHELDVLAKKARLRKRLIRTVWLSTFVAVASLAWLGIQRGIDLNDARNVVAQTETLLQSSESKQHRLEADLADVKTRFETSDAGKLALELQQTKDKLASIQSAFQVANDAMARADADATQARQDLDRTKTQLVAAQSDAAKARANVESLKSQMQTWGPAPTDTRVITSVSFSANGSTVAAATRDERIGFWNLDNGSLMRTVDMHHKGHVLAIAPVNASKWMTAILAPKNTLQFWAGESSEPLRSIHGDWGPITSCGFSPDNKLFAFGSVNGRIWIVRPETGEQLGRPLSIEHVSRGDTDR